VLDHFDGSTVASQALQVYEDAGAGDETPLETPLGQSGTRQI
jgi:hypothetical protein